MRGRKTTLRVTLSPDEVQDLESRLQNPSTPQGLARRYQVVLQLNRGRTITDAARETGFTQRNARKWICRYLESGLAGLNDRPGRGRRPMDMEAPGAAMLT